MNLVIGSRGSALALWQSEWAKSRLLEAHHDLAIEIEVIRTTGDTNISDSFAEIDSKGLFTKEVDEALLVGRTDFSVHSLKDLPTSLPDGLQLTAVSPREDVRDALCTSGVDRLDALRPDLELVPLRGNVDTRVRKLDDGDMDAIVLAGAGLKRLRLEPRITEFLSADRFVPAPGQGVMAIVSRTEDSQTSKRLAVIEDQEARVAITAERCALAELGGGCKIPFGAWSRPEGDQWVMDGVVAHPERSGVVRAQVEGTAETASDMGRSLAALLREQGGEVILDEVLA